MDLAMKLKALRDHAGRRRGLERALTQSEVARAIRTELGGSISQGYLSQLEAGRRTHLTATSRGQLARFFGVHPGYLVSDPEPHVQDAHGAGLPFQLHHPSAQHTLARLAVHPRRHHIWPLVDHLIDLPDEEFARVNDWLRGRMIGVGQPGEPFRPYEVRSVEGDL